MRPLIKFSILLLFTISCTVSVTDNPEPPVWTEADRSFLVEQFEKSRSELMNEVQKLTEEQWNFKKDSASWSIAEIVEHLGLQEDMHFREAYVISKTPEQPLIALQTVGNDEKVLSYENNPIKTIAVWFVQPLGRWKTMQDAINQFNRSRDKNIEFVGNTDKNLRVQITFRDIPDENDFRRVRNLHQIYLTTIAHTRRHIHQIEGIKKAEGFPAE